MGLEVAPVRPLARLVVKALSGDTPRRGGRAGPYVPPLVGTPAVGTHAADSGTEFPDASVRYEMLLRAILIGERNDELGDWIAPEVLVWSPVHHSSSRAELLAGLHDPSDDDDTLSEVVIEATSMDVVLPRVYLEWRLTARFSHPCFIDDDLLVEPTGRLVETAGVLVSTLADGVIISAHCYYDDSALLEQLVAGF
jgi:hypothetical protein